MVEMEEQVVEDHRAVFQVKWNVAVHLYWSDGSCGPKTNAYFWDISTVIVLVHLNFHRFQNNCPSTKAVVVSCWGQKSCIMFFSSAMNLFDSVGEEAYCYISYLQNSVFFFCIHRTVTTFFSFFLLALGKLWFWPFFYVVFGVGRSLQNFELEIWLLKTIYI